MGFEALLHKPLSEPQLLELLVNNLQTNFNLYQNTYYFFKLKEVDEETSEIIWLKTFRNKKEYADFVYSAKFFQAAIMLKFCEGHYEVFCRGFSYLDVFEVWPEKILNSRPINEYYADLEKTPMPPRELIEKGFGEITHTVAKSKSNVPV